MKHAYPEDDEDIDVIDDELIDSVTIKDAVPADNSNTQVSTREVPWMKLGKIKDGGAMTAEEAAVAGGLNFKVEKRNLYMDEPNDVLGITKIVERSAIARSDNGKWLGIMSKDYPLLQYGEAFDFMNTIEPTYVAAGALKGGKQGFMVVKAPENFSIMSDYDRHDMYFVLRTSHDGSRAIEVSVMPLRDRCMNQLTLSSFSKGIPDRWSVKHTSTMHAKLKDAQDSLTNMNQYADRFEHIANRLIDISVTDGHAEKILKLALPDRPRRDDQISTIINSWHTAETVGTDFDWTGWGLLNAVSDYFDWGRSGGTAESRFVGALQGQTRNAINKTAEALLQTV